MLILDRMLTEVLISTTLSKFNIQLLPENLLEDDIILFLKLRLYQDHIPSFKVKDIKPEGTGRQNTN